jgi:hypothetical protein
MTTSQHISRSQPELEDGENFLAYVPFDHSLKLPDGEQFHVTTKPEWRWNFIHKNRFPLDKDSPEHVEKYFNTGTNWTGEVAPGIFEIYYDYNLMAGLHIIASKPWICYVNKLENTVFAKLFEPYSDKLEYEHGVNVAIYNSGMETGYLETEVKTPIHTLQAGESFEYQEIQAAAKVLSLPVLDINRVGVITEKLNFDDEKNTLSGEYGVFIEGKAVIQLLNKKDKIRKEIPLTDTDPFHPFSLEFILKKQRRVSHVKLLIKDKNHNNQLLDSYDIINY